VQVYLPLFNSEAQRNGVGTDAPVSRENRHEGGRVTQGCRGRQMNCVRGTDRFHRKGGSGVGEDGLSDTYDVTTPAKPLDGAQRRRLLLNRDPSRKTGAKHRSSGFGHCQSGCHPLRLSTDGGLCRQVTLEQSGALDSL